MIKDTFFTDVLETLGLITIPVQPDTSLADVESGITASQGAMGEVASNPSLSSIDSSISNSSKNTLVKDDVNEAVHASPKDPFLVEWNGPADRDNPQNWSKWKKFCVVLQVMALTCITYMGSPIYTPGQEQIQKEFGVGHVVATLNLSVYVLGYGIGPMLFSPLSEISMFGRQTIYIVTLFVFTIFQIGAATVQNIGGLIVIRFFSGIFCSPALATGGATITDMMSPKLVPIILGLWSVGAIAAPVIAPLIGATMVISKGWRWIFWLQLWLSTALLVTLILFFPETHAGNILYRRSRRLKKATGDSRYYTAGEVIDKKSTVKDFLVSALYKPFKIIIKEPAVLAVDLYISLCYGVFYLFFEAFPIVFTGVYHFTLVENGLAYLGFAVGCCIAYSVLLLFLNYVVFPKMKNGTFVPETLMVLAMSVSWSLPASLLIFGWTARVHWILPIIAELFFVLCVFNLFQVTFTYLAICYQKHVASVFAGNGFCRAAFAGAFPLFGTAMFNNLGSEKYPVGWGSTLLAFIAMAMMLIPIALYKYGSLLRSKSKFTE